MRTEWTARHHYQPVTAERFLCLAAALEMVLRAEGATKFDQQVIAETLGVCYPEAGEDLVAIRSARTSPDPGNWGISASARFVPIFTEASLSLEDWFVPGKGLEDWSLVTNVAGALGRGGHVILGFSYAKLFGRSEMSENEGHVGLVTTITWDVVTFIDPGPRDAGEKRVAMGDLLEAIKTGKGGLWIIQPT